MTRGKKYVIIQVLIKRKVKMTIFNILVIMGAVVVLLGVIFSILSREEYYGSKSIMSSICLWAGLIMVANFTTISIRQPIELKEEQVERTTQREQIMHQIEHLDENTDKVFFKW